MARSTNPILARATAMSIVSRLRAAGHEAYFAGGCVRDELLGLQPTDYDIATNATPPQIKAIFSHSHAVGEHFGVMLVHLDECVVEVATFRADGSYSDSRRPDSVTFTTAEADAQRRDFTINALLLDPSNTPGTEGIRGRVIDYVGGLDDLHARIIRAVGDPDQRLNEDHLRALRAVRFTARLGFTLDPATADAITRHARDLRGVSRERIGEELRRMLAHPSRAAAVRLLQALKLDAPVLEGPAIDRPLTTLAALTEPVPTRRTILTGEADNSSRVESTLALAAWLLDRHGVSASATSSSAAQISGMRDTSSQTAESLGVPIMPTEQLPTIIRDARRALCLSNDERAAISNALTDHAALATQWLAMTVANQKRQAAHPGFSLALALLGAQSPPGRTKIEARLADLRAIGGGMAPDPWLTGDDLIMIGLRSGPKFKIVLDQAYDAQLEDRVKTKSELLELARELSV